MAFCRSRHVLRLSQNFFCKTRLLDLNNTLVKKTACRTLYSDTFAGLDAHKRHSQDALQRLGSLKGEFLSRMETYMESGPTNVIFTDDLKTALFIADDEDSATISLKMLKRYLEQRKQETLMGMFRYGPVAMRTLHLLNMYDAAHELFTDSVTKQLFDSYFAKVLYMDLMFKNKQYENVLEIAKEFEDFPAALSNDSMTLTLAACCKLGTTGAYELASKIREGTKTRGLVTRRSRAYLAKLSLDQNQPEAAVEILMQHFPERRVDDSKSPEVANLLVLAYLQAKSYGNLLDVLQSMVGLSVTEQLSRPYAWLCKEVFTKAKAAIEDQGDETKINVLGLVEKNLIRNQQLTDYGLEDFLFRPIVRTGKGPNRGYRQARKTGASLPPGAREESGF